MARFSAGVPGAPGVAGVSPVTAVTLTRLPHWVAMHAHGVVTARPEADVAGDLLQEVVGVEVPAEAVDVGAVLPQRRDAEVDGLGHVDEVGRLAAGYHVGSRDRRAHGPGLGEHPLVGRVPAGVERGQADGPVIGVVDRRVLRPGQVEVHSDHHVGTEAAERRGKITAQRDAVLDEPVRVIEELHLADADDRGAPQLLFHPQRPDLSRRHARDAGLSPCREQVADLLALPGPAGDGGGRAVLEIVRVGDDGDGALPVLRHGLHPVGSLQLTVTQGPGGRWPRPRLYNTEVPCTSPLRRIAGPAAGWPSTNRSKNAMVTAATTRSNGLVPQ